MLILFFLLHILRFLSTLLLGLFSCLTGRQRRFVGACFESEQCFSLDMKLVFLMRFFLG